MVILQTPREMHYQAGIDWMQAARLAMGASPQPTFPAYYDEVVPECRSSQFEAENSEKHEPTIKYPPVSGKHLNRDPQRDSFLRGGEQFRSANHNGVARERNVEQGSLPARLYGSLKRKFSRKARDKATSKVQLQQAKHCMPTKPPSTDEFSRPVHQTNPLDQCRTEFENDRCGLNYSNPSHNRPSSFSGPLCYEDEKVESRADSCFGAESSASCHHFAPNAVPYAREDKSNPWSSPPQHESQDSSPFVDGEMGNDDHYQSYVHKNSHETPEPIVDLIESCDDRASGNRKVSRVELHDFADESAVLVEHPCTTQDREAIDKLGSDESIETSARVQQHGLQSHQIRVTRSVHIRDRLFKVLEHRRHRTASAALRERTLNDWSSDDSIIDEPSRFQENVVEELSDIKSQAAPVSLRNRPLKGPARCALGELNHNELHQAYPVVRDNLIHHDLVTGRARSVKHASTQGSNNARRKFSNETRRSTTPGLVRNGSGKVKSCIQGFEDKIMENKIRGERCVPRGSTSPRTCSRILPHQEKACDSKAGVSPVVTDRFGSVRLADPSFGVHNDHSRDDTFDTLSMVV